MSKYYGIVAYGITTEGKFSDDTPDGTWVTTTVERPYYGEVNKSWSSSRSQGTSINDDITLNNEISILADAFALNNFSNILYVTYMNVKWKVTNVEVCHPRLILTLGGRYNDTGGST